MTALIEKPIIEVVSCPHPFKIKQDIRSFPQGVTLLEILETIQPNPALRQHAHISIMGKDIPKEDWANVYPHAGTAVVIRVIPSGGGGGGKSIFRLILTIAVIALSVWVSGGALSGVLGSSFAAGTTGAAIAGGLTTLVGGLLINAIIPPSVPSLNEVSGSSDRDSATLSISGARNRGNPFGVVPKALGTHRMFPPFAAQQITEIHGDDQYVRGVVCWGVGPLTISDIKIGETLITAFEDVELETLEGQSGDSDLSLYPNDIYQESVSVLLEEANSPTERTSQVDTDELSVDITFIAGLARIVDGGQKQDFTVDVLVEYRVTDPVGSWVSAGTISTTARKTVAVRKALRWSVTRDQYDVRLSRTTLDNTETTVADDVTWTAFRSITNEAPYSISGLALTAFRIKATDQLNGVLDQLNGIVESQVNTYDGVSAWAVTESNNPAALFREVLQGGGNGRPIADARIDVTGLEEWHDFCVTNGFTFNRVIDYETTVMGILQDIASAGRASPAMKDGLWGVVIDQEATVPIQHFTPHNSWGFKGAKAFKTLPHAWRVRFVNEDKGYIQDERIIPFEDYTEETATEYEGLEFTGVTDPDLIFKHAKYFEAVTKLRPETYKFHADIEHLVCTRGDLIRLVHDIPLFGVGSGRVTELTTNGSNELTDVTINDSLTMLSGESYSFRFRKTDGETLVVPVDTVAGTTNSFTLTTPISSIATQPEVGDLALFGVTDSESVEMIVKEIRPGPDFSAELTCVDAAPLVHVADQITIPTFNSQITTPASAITQPVIENIRSDSTVVFINPDGTPEVRILVSLGMINLLRLDKLAGLEAKLRETGSAGPWSYLPLQPNDAREVSFLAVQEGENYDVSLRYLYKDGTYSDYTEELGHQVTGIINNARNEKVLEWPGTLVDCHVNPQGNLISNGTAAISTLASTISALADSIRDIVASADPITYETPEIDLGGDVVVTPRMTVTADDGTATNTMQTGTDADGSATGSHVSLGLVTARYFKLKTSVAAGAVPARITEFLTNLDTLTTEENYLEIDMATESGLFFESIATGHFKIETKGAISRFTIARIDAFVGAGAGFTSDLISIDTTLTSRSVLAAEFKVYDSTNALADAVVTISLIGAKV